MKCITVKLAHPYNAKQFIFIPIKVICLVHSFGTPNYSSLYKHKFNINPCSVETEIFEGVNFYGLGCKNCFLWIYFCGYCDHSF